MITSPIETNEASSICKDTKPNAQSEKRTITAITKSDSPTTMDKDASIQKHSNIESESMSIPSMNAFVSEKNTNVDLPKLNPFKSTDAWNDDKGMSEDLELSEIKEVIESLEMKNSQQDQNERHRRSSLIRDDEQYLEEWNEEDVEESQLMMVNQMSYLRKCLDKESTNNESNNKEP